MSWSERRTVLAGLGAAMLALPGCLRPMLAADAPAAGLRGQIAFPETSDRFDYYLRESLAARLGETATAAYRLNVGQKRSEIGLAIARDNSATRVTVLVEASWQLVRLRDGTPVLSDEVTLQSGYNATTSLFATRQTKRDIERRLARTLGERIARTIQARAAEIPA